MVRVCSERIRSSTLFTILAAVCIAPVLSNRVCAQDRVAPPKRVLILYSFDNEQELYAGFDRVLRSQLRMRVRGRVEFYTEYLDLVRFPSPEHAQDMVKLLAPEYGQRRPDLIVPVSFSAMQFLFNDGKTLFPGTPMVGLFNERHMNDLKAYLSKTPAANITGVAGRDDLAGTVDLVLKLQPDTQHVAIIVGSSGLEKYWLDQLHNELDPYAEKVDLRFLANLPMNELLQRIADLPPHSVIVNTFFFQDAGGQFLLPEEVLDLIARTAHAPIYGIYSSYIGHGVVGGRMTNPEITAKKLADLAVPVLNGENARNIPIVRDDSVRDTVDGRELRHWGISESRLPPSTLELFREPSAWVRYRTLILSVIAIGIFQSLLIVALILNIKRRRGAEKALLREKSLADAVIEGLPGIFVLQDKTGKNIRWNRNMESISRQRPDEVETLGNVAEPDRQKVGLARDEVFRNGSAHIEAELLIENGKTAPFYLTGVKVDLEGKPHLAAIGIDVTERKKAEDALRRSEAAMRSLVENAPYGIATISVHDDRFLQANPAMVKLLGYKSEAEVSKLLLSRDVYSESDAYGLRTQLTRTDFFTAVEFAWKRQDGKPIHVRASGHRIAHRQNQGDLIEIIAEDVTAQRSLEEQLRHSQKMEALGKLSGSVAHDFNNLLGVIIGYSELLSTNSAIEGSMKEQLSTIKKAGERAASLTAQLLAFSRRQVMQFSVVSLNSLVRETEKMFQRLMRENVTVETSLDPDLWKVRADAGQIVQVIMNLAINARDAMPMGGTLSIRTANVNFEDAISLSGIDVVPGHYVMLSVTDTGIGMDQQTLAKIFEPFFTTKTNGKGTGLGLATVFGIVKQSGGYIFANSELKKGTTLTIYIPRLEHSDEPVSTNVAHGQPADDAGSETVLVVEDETAFRDLLRDGLRARGYEVLEAVNGMDALHVAEQFPREIRMVVTDVIMPHMSGPELASALRKLRPNTNVLYMSGYSSDEVQEESSSGELTLMQKPFQIDQLAVRIREILARPIP